MSKTHISITMPKNKINKDDIEKTKDQNKQRKDTLYKKFKETNSKLVKELNNNVTEEKNQKIDNNTTNNNDSDLLKTLKKQFNLLENKYEILQKENKQIKAKETKNKIKYSKLYEDYKLFKSTLSINEEEIKRLSSENKNLKRKIENSNNISNEEIIKKIQKEKDLYFEKSMKYKNKIENLSNMIDNLNKQINDAESFGKFNDTFSYKGKYENLKRKYNNLMKKYNCKNSTDRTYKSQVFKLYHIISTLKKVNIDLLKEYELNKLYSFMEYWMRFNYRNKLPISQNIKDSVDLVVDNTVSIENTKKIYFKTKELTNYVNNTQNNILDNTETDDFKIIEDIKYGYIIFDDNIFYVKTTENILYPIINQEDCKLDYPCKVQIINNEAIILKTYNSTNEETIFNKVYLKQVKSRRNKNIEELSNYYFNDFKDKTVLIVSNSYKNLYVSALSKCGLNIIWHDAFQENEDVFINKTKNVDIVILCANHISHAILNVIDKENNKFQIIYNDSIKNILARIKYALVVMNKI